MNPIFDLDGVLLDFATSWAQCASWELGRPIQKVSDAYDLQERFALSAREYHRVRSAFHRYAWWERVPTTANDRVEALKSLRAQAFIDDQPANVNAAACIVAAPVLLHQNYQGQEEPAHGVTVIDHLLDFPLVIEPLCKAAKRA